MSFCDLGKVATNICGSCFYSSLMISVTYWADIIPKHQGKSSNDSVHQVEIREFPGLETSSCLIHNVAHSFFITWYLGHRVQLFNLSIALGTVLQHQKTFATRGTFGGQCYDGQQQYSIFGCAKVQCFRLGCCWIIIAERCRYDAGWRLGKCHGWVGGVKFGWFAVMEKKHALKIGQVLVLWHRCEAFDHT